MTSIRHIAAPATLLAALVLATTAPAQEAQPVSQMTLSATGRAAAAPDQAIVRFGVTTVGRDAAEAMARNSTAMRRAFEALSGAGISMDDIETSGLRLSPQMSGSGSGGERTEPRIEGYRAENSVGATVGEVSRVGPVIDALVDSGVNTIQGIEFSIADTGALEELARDRAAAELRRKASQYAAAFGTPIEGILSISEAGGRAGPQPMMMAARAASTPIAAGDHEVSVTVTATFRLGEP